MVMGTLVDKIFQTLFFLSFGAIVIAGIVLALPKWHKSHDLTAEKARIENKIKARQAEIAAMRDNQSRFNTDREFVEMLARKNHRLFPGEVVFVFDK